VIISGLKARRGLAPLITVFLAVIILLAGIWLGGHPGDLPSPLRGSFFESRSLVGSSSLVRSPSLVLVNQALNVLTTRYYRRLDRPSLIVGALSGMVASLDDPYSQYLDPQAYRERNHEPQHPPGGIGINTDPEARGLRVTSVRENSPAAGAGMKSGDLIIKVGMVSLADRAESGGDLIRGPVGTTVELTLLRDGTEHVISVERANLVPPVASLQMLSYHHRRIGHLTFTRFTQGAGDRLRSEVRAALERGPKG
jgi:carboxyl-terminal processing protease